MVQLIFNKQGNSMSLPYLFREQLEDQSLEDLDRKTNSSYQKCAYCHSARFCLPSLCISNGEDNSLLKIAERQRIFHANEYIIHKGESQRYLYAIHSGCCKSYFVDTKGREHVNNFYYPGDIIGLESLFSHRYLVNVVAMDTSNICYINLNHFKSIINEVPDVREQLLNIFSQQLWQAYSMKGSFKAKELVVQFLINISVHSRLLGQSGSEFTLPMGRQDIANFLGLSSETVSRVITSLKQDKIINVNRHSIELCDIPRLNEIAANSLF